MSLQRARGLVGLGLRGRLAIVGVQQVRDAAKRGKLKLALVAPDASANSLDKVVPLLRARRVRTVEAFSAADLGRMCGRESVAVIGIVDAGLARGIRAAASDTEPSERDAAASRD
ncbi:MAG TPA: ribosomal L7Ae/L30e/S12e/Gadd45 family protein [Gemmatimonadaceae bacterium]|jgi:ribosomal protein L7Ae-like RNA K-turn-binding protein